MDYSPSAQTAWESVNYIQNEMWGGWLLRGLHHYTAQILPVLLALHLLQSSFTALTRRARGEFLVWADPAATGVDDGIDGLSTAVGQKGFSATKVNLICWDCAVDWPAVQRILIGARNTGT